MDKLFVSGNELYESAFALSRLIYDSGYKPDVIIGVWRGGTPVGITVHEALKYLGIRSDHYPLKAGLYAGDKPGDTVKHETEGLLARLQKDSKVLVVDDVFDTGKTLATIAATLNSHVASTRLATLYYKPEKNQTSITPDYYMHRVPGDVWIVFPHELEDLSLDEIRKGKGDRVANAMTPHSETR